MGISQIFYYNGLGRLDFCHIIQWRRSKFLWKLSLMPNTVVHNIFSSYILNNLSEPFHTDICFHLCSLSNIRAMILQNFVNIINHI